MIIITWQFCVSCVFFEVVKLLCMMITVFASIGSVHVDNNWMFADCLNTDC